MTLQDNEQSRYIMNLPSTSGVPGGFTRPGGFTTPGGPVTPQDLMNVIKALGMFGKSVITPQDSTNRPTTFNPANLRISTRRAPVQGQAQTQAQPQAQGTPPQSNPSVVSKAQAGGAGKLPVKPGSVEKSIKAFIKSEDDKAKKARDDKIREMFNGNEYKIDESGKITKDQVAGMRRASSTEEGLNAKAVPVNTNIPMPKTSMGERIGDAIASRLGDPGFRLELARLAQSMSKVEPNSTQASVANYLADVNSRMVMNNALQGNYMSDYQKNSMSPEMIQAVQTEKQNAINLARQGQPDRSFDLVTVQEGDKNVTYKKYKNGTMEKVAEGDKWAPQSEGKGSIHTMRNGDKNELLYVSADGNTTRVLRTTDAGSDDSDRQHQQGLANINRALPLVDERLESLFGSKFYKGRRTNMSTMLDDYSGIYDALTPDQRKAYDEIRSQASAMAYEGKSPAYIAQEVTKEFEDWANGTQASTPFVVNSQAELNAAARTAPDGSVFILNNKVYKASQGKAIKIADNANTYMGVK